MENILFCGIGSHATSVFELSKTFNLNRVYIVYSEYNTEEFVIKIESLKRDIAELNAKIGNILNILYIQIDEHKIEQSFNTIYTLYLREKNNYIITDLTAGHKSISILLWYSHMFIQKFAKKSSIVYFPYNNTNPTIYPQIQYQSLPRKEELFLVYIYKYHQNTLLQEKGNKKKRLSLPSYLSNLGYPRSSISRYRHHLTSIKYIKKNNIDISGYFYLKGNNLI